MLFLQTLVLNLILKCDRKYTEKFSSKKSNLRRHNN